jgi:hypothetical protein
VRIRRKNRENQVLGFVNLSGITKNPGLLDRGLGSIAQFFSFFVLAMYHFGALPRAEGFLFGCGLKTCVSTD